MTQAQKPEPENLCRSCRHYHVTWDVKFPHGCRALSFKSSKPPCVEVFQTSGMPCQAYSLKPRDVTTAKR